MPNEIPDSDEESDYEAWPEKRGTDPSGAEQDQLTMEDKGLGVNFDDFISQSQSAKDGSSQLGQTKRSTASTQKHLQDALENRRGSASSSYDGAGDMDQNAGDAQVSPPEVGKRKRAHSEIGGGHSQRGSSQNRAKRSKTYGSSSRRATSTQDMEEASEAANMDRTTLISPSAEVLPPQEPEDEEDIIPRAKERPRRIVSMLGDSVSNVGHVLSVSNSSMGEYQSYNLDYRGSVSGLDVNVNPFGPPSQASVEASLEHTADESQFDLSTTVRLSATPRRPGRDDISPFTDDGTGLQPLADTSRSLDSSLLTFQLPEESHMLTSPVVTAAARESISTFAATSVHDVTESQLEVEDASNHVNANIGLKERGPNSKSSRQPSLASTQDIITDQQKHDECAIGLPKEQYKPRLSKCRGATIESERQSQAADDEVAAKKSVRKKSLEAAPKEAEHNSPAKLPTSELNLSDEATVGLPKENYKPRPTRRSRIAAEDDEASIEVDIGGFSSKDLDQAVQGQQSMRSEALHTLEVAEAPTPKPKKGKKAKVKRAKTSAAGLLRKSEPMISDGEDDVLWMDTKPAKVKLDVPAEKLGKTALKEEHTAESTVSVEASISEESIKGSEDSSRTPPAARSKIVTVEIPARTEKDKPEPKKRGRKAKAVTVSEEDDVEPELNESAISTSATHTSSTILKDKDPNASLPPPTPMKQTESSSPSKPARITHSPINPSGGKVLYRVGLSRRSAIPPLLKIVKPPAKQQVEKENLDEEGQPRDLVAETMKKWRGMGVLD